MKAIVKVIGMLTDGDYSRYILAAPTGMAAFLFKGRTLHNVCQLPVKDVTKLESLEGQGKARLEDRWKDVDLLIIDEQSMVGLRMLGHIDARLRQAKGKPNLPFGGVHVTIVVDNGQLPPVNDKPKFDLDSGRWSTSSHAAAGAALYVNLFNTVVQLRQPMRQDANDPFYGMLQRLREGEVTKEDWNVWKTRSLAHLPMDEKHQFMDALWLYPTRTGALEHNLRCYERLGNPMAVLHAQDSHPSVGKDADANHFMGLESRVVVALGSRVTLRRNLWTGCGFVNGAMGTVRAIVYVDGEGPPHLPLAIIVEFDDYARPGYQGVAWHVPLTASSCEATLGSRNVSRTQFPIILAFSINIHKSQGFTIGEGRPITKAVVNLGNREGSAGLSFVALSQVKVLPNLALHPCPSFDRLDRLKSLTQLHKRKLHDTYLTQ